MANAGTFQLLTNDGRQDRMLMASSFLKKRLTAIQAHREQDPSIRDPTPTLLDIEKTHVLFMNAHFKPFAAVGFEYAKVSATPAPSALNASSTSTATFQLPNFGDFFYDMCLHVVATAPTVTVTAADDEDKPAARWCDFPGERMLEKTSFNVSNNPLDEYTYMAYNTYRQMCLSRDKYDGWCRAVGQEVPLDAYVKQNLQVGNGVAAQSHRVKLQLCKGAQTPMTTQSDLEMFIPLMFWFNKDYRLAVAAVSLPQASRQIVFTLAATSSVFSLVPRGDSTTSSLGGSIGTVGLSTVELYVNNIFVNPEVHDIFIRRVGFTLIRVHRIHSETVNAATANKQLTTLKWPIEAMFVSFALTTNLTSYDKWHCCQKITDTEYGLNALSAGSAPIASAATSVAITAAGAVTGVASAFITEGAEVGDQLYVTWATGLTHTGVITAATSATALTIVPGPHTSIASAVAKATIIKSQKVVAPVPTALVSAMTVSAYAVNIYNNFPAAFYNAYIPLRHGGKDIVTPKDSGMMMVTFALAPGSYQPSGHLNISRAREFYLEYTSSVITSSVTAVMTVVASAINFLLITDGSAILRYTT